MATSAQIPLTSPAKSSGPFASPEKKRLILCLLLAAATVLLYNPVNRHPFINYDDDRYVVQNQHIRGLSAENIRWAFTTTAEANWHPLTWLSHALDYALFHLNAGGHHLDSVLLHAVNVVLLFLLLLWGTGRYGRSFIVAALFAVLPLNVESVAWVAERKNLLCTFFMFLALWAYGWYARRPDWRRYMVVVAAFACGLMSKPMVITFPFALLLIDFWPLGRLRDSEPGLVGGVPVPQQSGARLLAEKIPLLGLSAASAWITMHAQRAGGAVRSATQFSLSVRLENSIVAYADYLWKMIWPAKLAVLYPHPGNSLPPWQIAVSIPVLLGISVVAWRCRSKRYLGAGWLWYLGTLVPVIGIVQVGYQAMADRYTYIPLLGIFVMIVWGAADVFDRWKVPLAWRAVPAVLILVSLSWATHRQIGYWASSYDLWSHTLSVNPQNFIAEDNLGDSLLALGKPDQAFAHFQRAAEIMPRDPWSHANMGAYLQQHGRLREAIEQYVVTLNISVDPPMRALVFTNLGTAFRDVGDYADARASYDQALAIAPNLASAYFARGLLLEKQNQIEAAVNDFSKAVQIQPTAQAYFQLGKALAEAHRRDEALAAFDQALRLAPDFTEAQQAAAALTRSH